MAVRAFFRPTDDPHWRSTRRQGADEAIPGQVGKELESELWIWRPIMAGKVTLSEVESGTATVDKLQKLNALLDMQADIENDKIDKAKRT